MLVVCSHISSIQLLDKNYIARCSLAFYFLYCRQIKTRVQRHMNANYTFHRATLFNVSQRERMFSLSRYSFIYPHNHSFLHLLVQLYL